MDSRTEFLHLKGMDTTNGRADEGAPGMNPAAPGAPLGAEAFDGSKIEFPVSFDLRTIYVLADGAGIQVDVENILARHGVECSMTQGDRKPGAKYGRFGARVTFTTREQMHAVYAEIGALPYIKGVF